MKRRSLLPKLALAVALVAGALAAAPAPSEEIIIGPIPDCDRHGDCPDVYSPVRCSNGQVYANGCHAWLACATDCVPYGTEIE
jgi:hypothetical protein